MALKNSDGNEENDKGNIDEEILSINLKNEGVTQIKNEFKYHENEKEIKKEKFKDEIPIEEENKSENNFCDVTVVCDNKKLKAHKILTSENMSFDVGNLVITVKEVYLKRLKDLEVKTDAKTILGLIEIELSCDQCLKEADVKTRSKLHIGNFDCNICQKSFSQSSNPKCHFQTQVDHLKDNNQNFIHQVF